MPKIGIVLAGAASKGPYEIGCIRAIEEFFGTESIKYISSASVGSLITQAYGMGKIDQLRETWKGIDTKKHGRFFLSYSGNKELLQIISNMVSEGNPLPFKHYVSVWNYTKHEVQYIPFHNLPSEKLQKYLCGAIAIPFFSDGSVVDGECFLDGAFLDNIPVYPLLEKDLDYIFCVYFDNCKYFFENEEFDNKIIKLFDFPNEKMLELMSFKAESFDEMVEYGYNYTKRTIKEIFTTDNKEEIYKIISDREQNLEISYKPRLTADIVLNNINVMTRRYSKRLSNRKKKKIQKT